MLGSYFELTATLSTENISIMDWNLCPNLKYLTRGPIQLTLDMNKTIYMGRTHNGIPIPFTFCTMWTKMENLFWHGAQLNLAVRQGKG